MATIITNPYNQNNNPNPFNSNLGQKVADPSIKKTIFDELLESPDVNTMLLIGAAHGNLAVIDRAIDSGADVNTDLGVVLRYVAETGDVPTIKKMLSKGAKVNVNNNAAFRWACARGRLDAARELLQSGADPHDICDCALQWAIDYKEDDVVDWLKSLNCSVESIYKNELDELKKSELMERDELLARRPQNEK